MIIRRYLLKETLYALFVVVLVLLLIALSHKIVRIAALSADGQIPAHLMLNLVLYQIPELVAFLLPIGLFLSVLLTMGRLFADNEIQVMFACGISWQQLVRIIMMLAIGVALCVCVLTMVVNPKIAHHRDQLLKREGALLMAQTLSPGRFHSFDHDRFVVYVSRMADRSDLQDLFIAEQPKSGSATQKWTVVHAKQGEILEEEANTYFKMNQGMRFEGKPGHLDYNVTAFDSYQKRLDEVRPHQGLYYHRSMPTPMLWQNPLPSHIAELEWRISIPLATLMLAFLAVPLSRTNPREGRYSRVFVAIIVCIIYFNILTIFKRWVAKGVISAWLGLGWVHLIMLAVGVILLLQVQGRLHFKRWVTA